MSGRDGKDWDPGTYNRFRGFRLRPAIDLLSAVPDLPDAGDIVDLGCGNGTVGPALRARFPRHALVGVDLSPAMLAEAAEAEAYDALTAADIATWQPSRPAALIFANASLQWLDDHPRLFPRLAKALAPGGTLAVQMPHQNPAPSHRGWLEALENTFPGIRPAPGPDVLMPRDYLSLLDPLGEVTLWETDYFQVLPAAAQGHPVRHFTESTFGRPILQAVAEADQPRLIAAYEALLDAAYPLRSDGSVVFPFRRLFLTLRR